MIKPTKDIPEKSKIELVSTQKTSTVSGKSELTYHIGKDEDNNAYIRIWVNSSNGFFSNEWVNVYSIIDLLKKHDGASLTSLALEPLFLGKSVNTPGFLVAVLLHEGVLALSEGKKRKYVFVSADNLLGKVHKAKPRKKAKKAAKKSSK